jgi:hypothetical protein
VVQELLIDLATTQVYTHVAGATRSRTAMPPRASRRPPGDITQVAPGPGCSSRAFAARILGWIRLLVISTTFGALDPTLFFAAFRSLTDLPAHRGRALGTALIPVIAGLRY